jgi:hypothetical protein
MMPILQISPTTYKYKPSKVFVLEDKTEGETWMEYSARSTEAKLQALHHFYPQGFQSHKMQSKTILAATNRQIVQKMELQIIRITQHETAW